MTAAASTSSSTRPGGAGPAGPQRPADRDGTWTCRQASAPSPKRKPGRKAGWGCSASPKLRKLGCSPGRPCNARDPDRDRAASAEWERRSRVRTHLAVCQRAWGCAQPQPCASRAAELGPALRRPHPARAPAEAALRGRRHPRAAAASTACALVVRIAISATATNPAWRLYLVLTLRRSLASGNSLTARVAKFQCGRSHLPPSVTQAAPSGPTITPCGAASGPRAIRSDCDELRKAGAWEMRRASGSRGSGHWSLLDNVRQPTQLFLSGCHQRGNGGRDASVAKRNIVVERNSCPGFNSVLGKFGLLGLSGKCCVLSVNPSVWR